MEAARRRFAYLHLSSTLINDDVVPRLAERKFSNTLSNYDMQITNEGTERRVRASPLPNVKR
jgi:hypothetical protein